MRAPLRSKSKNRQSVSWLQHRKCCWSQDDNWKSNSAQNWGWSDGWWRIDSDVHDEVDKSKHQPRCRAVPKRTDLCQSVTGYPTETPPSKSNSWRGICGGKGGVKKHPGKQFLPSTVVTSGLVFGCPRRGAVNYGKQYSNSAQCPMHRATTLTR